MEDYRHVDGKPLGEKKVWLADDYVKFLRFAQWRIAHTGQGIVAMITNHGFLDNPTFRGMRQSLQRDFDEIFVFDLHGSTKKRQHAPGGGIDQNVFDIQQGVAITVFVRRLEHRGPATVFHADLWGTREEKYERLGDCDVSSVSWKKLSPSTPYYFFVPRSEKYRREYERLWTVKDILPVNTSGIVTARDPLAVDMDQADLRKRIDVFCDMEESDAMVKMRLGLSENYAWRSRPSPRSTGRRAKSQPMPCQSALSSLRRSAHFLPSGGGVASARGGHASDEGRKSRICHDSQRGDGAF